MTIFDPYNDPNRVPTDLGTGKVTRPTSDLTTRGSGQTQVSGGATQTGPSPSSSLSSSTITETGEQTARPRTRSAVLTAASNFTSLMTIAITLGLILLIMANSALCGDGLGTAACGDPDLDRTALWVAGAGGFAVLIGSMVAANRIKRAHNLLGAMLLTAAAGGMAYIIYWLRLTLELPFPWS